MQLFPLLLVAVVLIADGGVEIVGDLGLAAWEVLLLALGPIAVTVGVALPILHWQRRRLDVGIVQAARTADRVVRICIAVLLVNYLIAVLVLDVLGVVRGAIGDLLLVDELIVMVPTLAALAALWWGMEPVDRRLHDAALLRRLDAGAPIYPAMSRRGWVVQQFRHNILLLMVPMLVILFAGEAIVMVLPGSLDAQTRDWLTNGLTIAAGATIFVCSPLLVRHVLSLCPLPEGEIRSDMQAVCDQNRVRVRDLLLWRTNGMMLNAAVMGIAGPIRYVMLTDVLLDGLPRRLVQAVMAHEVGHVRRRHMGWMLIALLAAVSGVDTLCAAALSVLPAPADPTVASAIDIARLVVVLVVALLAFGWVSRRFERQADSFAVQHLTRFGVDGAPCDGELVDPDAVRAMRSALGAISRLGSVDPWRRNWRHGSIRWRQRYLGSLRGLQTSDLPIDRQVRRVKLASAVVLVLSLGWQAAMDWS